MSVESAIRCFVEEIVAEEVRRQLTLALAKTDAVRSMQQLVTQEGIAEHAWVDVATTGRRRKHIPTTVPRGEGRGFGQSEIPARCDSQAPAVAQLRSGDDAISRARRLAKRGGLHRGEIKSGRY